MYEKYFGFDELPFRLTPDPKYLFLSEKHREALGHLVFGIREGAGFVAVTGEIGAGKTTLLRALLRNSDEGIQYAYMLNPVLTGVELLQEINHELGIPVSESRRQLLTTLNDYLLAQRAAGRRVVIVVDEAQALDGAILEQLRLLSNFETESAKLLQIVLVGQPELRDMLARPSLAQLNQRITVRWHLGPLDRRETAQYIAHRVATAADGQAKSLFAPRAIAQVYRYSNGIPRLINIACHRALLVAFTSEATTVTGPIARQAVQELRLHEPMHRVPARRAWTVGVLGAGAVAVVTAVLAALATIGWSPLAERLAARGMLPQWAAAPAAAPGAGQLADRDGGAAAAPATGQGLDPGAPAHTSEPGGARLPAPQPAPRQDDRANDALAAAAVPPVAAEAAAEGAATPGDSVATAASAPGAASATQPATDHGGPLDVERATLADALRQVTPGNSAYEATQALLRAWKVKPLSAREAASQALDLPGIARARGLEYLSFYGNLNLLRVLDLPAILEIAPEDGSPSRFVTVDRLDDSRANVMVGRTTTEITPAVLAEAWFGRAHLFWRDFDRLGPVLAIGSSSNAVRRLHELLRAASAYDGTGSSLFAPETEQAVIQFQRTRRLFADGKVGPLTMIALYQKVDADRLPHLAAVPAAADGQGQGAGGPLGEQG